VDTVCDGVGVATSDGGYRMSELSIKNFPEELLKHLKVAAAQEGITLRELVVAALENSVKQKKSK
jgi:plasmid stability protein